MRAPSESRPPIVPPPIPAAEHVRRLAEAGRVDEARRFVEEHAADGDPSMERWAALLALPRVTTSPRRAQSDFAADHAWLHEHRDAFRGRWVALRDGELLDTDVTLHALVERLTARGLVQGAFIAQVD